MDLTAETVDESEFDRVGIQRTPAETVATPRVADANAALECEVSESVRIGKNTVVFGRVKVFHVDDPLLVDDEIDARSVDAVGRVGGPYYTTIDLMEFTRTF